ncbi:hypothetical protein [Lactococcus petauri]|uniref:hypothetical protein n=1 Tax=Lactococcus petauri TaxID=1940789 RepID=UPI00254E5DF4|nr:hypothetical protein [Lactococcus petauri]
MNKKISKLFLSLLLICVVFGGWGVYSLTQTKHEVVHKKVEPATTRTKVNVSKKEAQSKSENSSTQAPENSKSKTINEKKRTKEFKNFNEQAIAKGFYIEIKNKEGRKVLERVTNKNLEAIENSGKQPVAYQMNYKGKMVQVIRIGE